VEKTIPQEDEYERLAREYLSNVGYTNSQRSGQYYNMADALASPSNIATTTLGTMQQQNQVFGQQGQNAAQLGALPAKYDAAAAMYRPQQETLMNEWAADDALKKLQEGTLSDAFYANMAKAIELPVKEMMGSSLNNLANRGIVNSSVTGKAMSGVGQQAAAMTAQNYNQGLANAINAAQGMTQSRAGQMSGWSGMRNDQYAGLSGQLGALTGQADALKNQAATSTLPLSSLMQAGNYLTGTGDAYNKQLMDLYSMWRQTRYGLQSDSVVSQQPGALSYVSALSPLLFLL
jgi:hypothetical protein